VSDDTAALDAYFRLGETIRLGTHTFGADEIKDFARKYDPQPFHLDEAMAAKSVFGRLCASGWHTCAMWMRHNLLHREDAGDTPWTGGGPKPVFGPSPGFENLKWSRPVYAGDTIGFWRRAESHRALATKPGWRMLVIICGADDAAGNVVMQFDSSVLVKVQ
jgi:acyl dehydratase